jgi:Leu/Phe-tRNA-protein transferase
MELCLVPEAIYQITRDMLSDPVVRRLIEQDVDRTLYWTPEWDASFYVELARAGFIATAYPHPEIGAILLPELQAEYAVLDWGNLVLSRNLRRLLRSGRLEDDGIELRIAESCDRVAERIVAYHTPKTWLLSAYRDLLKELPTGARPDFAIHGIELWSKKENQLIAGELGYSVGRSYTSLTGFCTRTDPRWRNFGTLQIVLLARELEERGYDYWNLGHPQLTYKLTLGARKVPRARVLERLRRAKEGLPHRPLGTSN